MSFGSARLTDGLAKAIPSYAAFVAAETARSTSGSKGPADIIGFPTGVYRTTLSSAGHDLSGSPWQNSFSGRALSFARHAFPSEPVYNVQLAAGRLISYTVTYLSDGALDSVTRNGLTSSANPETSYGRCTDFRYYDDVLGPVKMNPFAGTGPTPYTLGT